MEFSLLIALLVAADFAVIAFFGPAGRSGFDFWLSAIAFFAPIVLAGAAVVRRLHDLNLPAIIAFLFTTAVKLLLAGANWIGLAAGDEFGLFILAAGGLCLAVAPGSTSENDFGPARTVAS
jgi:uncharacterized membrane protein YhaH (DUF805 family)